MIQRVAVAILQHRFRCFAQRAVRASVLLAWGVAAVEVAAQGSDTAALRSAENLQRQLNQEDAEMRQAYYANAPISERLSIEYGGTFRYAFNIIDTAQSQETYQQIYDLRLFTSVELDGAHRFFGRLRFQYNQWDFRGTRAIGPDYDDVGWQNPIGEIYWYEFNLAGMIRAQTGNKPDYNFVAKVGRQYVIWGQGAALSNYMYAGIFDFSWRDWKATALIGVTSGNDTIDWDLSRPGYDTDTQRLFYGGKLEYSGFAGHRPYVYLLAQKDLNEGQVALLPAALPTIPTTFNYDSSYVGLGSNGSLGAGLVYRAECMYEYGTTLSDPLPRDGTLNPVPQQNSTISAVAGLGGLTWLGRDPADSRIDFQIVAGSGSSDRLDAGNTFGGIAPGAVDTSFNSLGYVNTGLVLSPDFANLLCPSVGFSTSPFPGGGIFHNFRIGVTGFLFGRILSNAPLSFQTQPGGTNYVGGEVDFSLEWRLLSDLDLSFKYGIFMPNQAAFAPSQSGTRDFVYIGGTFAF